MIALSFVRKGSDIDYVRELLGPRGANIKLIAKIENQEGLDNYDDILAKVDGIMVARGDLGPLSLMRALTIGRYVDEVGACVPRYGNSSGKGFLGAEDDDSQGQHCWQNCHHGVFAIISLLFCCRRSPT